MIRRTCWVAALAAFSLAAQGTGIDAARFAVLHTRLQTAVDRQEIAGAVALVARHGAVIRTDAVGYQDLENKVPMRADSIFQIMSMTKPITCVGIMMLAEEGKLGLTDPVERHLPEFRGQKIALKQADGSVVLRAPLQPVTIRDLMTHTSGVPSGPPVSIPNLFQNLDVALADAVHEYAKQPLNFEPGSKWEYSNAGIATLGRIIEVASDQPYEKFIEDRILAPLGMRDTSFTLPEGKHSRLALVYKRQGDRLVRSGANLLGGDPTRFRPNAKYPAPEFGLYSTAPDLLKFYQMMLNKGVHGGRRYLSPASVQLMSEVQTGDIRAGWYGHNGYGLGFEVINDRTGELLYLTRGTFGHGGAYGTQGWIDPKLDMIRIFMIQREGNADPIRNAFFSITESAVTN